MQSKLTLLFIFLSCGFSYSQNSKSSQKPTIGGLFNYSTPKQPQVTVTTIIRGTYPVYKKISVGAEVNYTQSFGTYGNSDNAGAIGYARMNPYIGFIGEIGYSYNKNISSARNNPKAITGLYAAIGYQVKISKQLNMEFQYRALPMKYLENGVVNSKIYLLGLNYTFK